jgi:hypothetical protein
VESKVNKEISVIGFDRPATVDDEDFEWAQKHDWFLDENGFVVKLRQPGEEGLADDDDVIEMGTEVYCCRTGLSLSQFIRPRHKPREIKRPNERKRRPKLRLA